MLNGKVVEPEAIYIRRWKDDNVIGYTTLVPWDTAHQETRRMEAGLTLQDLGYGTG